MSNLDVKNAALERFGITSGPPPVEENIIDTPAGAANPPAANIPDADPPAPAPDKPDPAAPAAAPDVDKSNPSDLLKGIFGDEWNDPAKIKEALNKAKTDPLDAIKDGELKELVKATNAGIKREAYEAAKKINLDDSKVTDADKMSLYMQLKKGFSKEDADKYVSLTYRLGENDNAEDPQVELARLNLKDHVSDYAENWLRDKKTEFSTPPTQRQLEKWNPEIPKLVAEHAKISIPVPGIDTPFVFAINPADTAEMENFLKGIVGNIEGFTSPQDEGAIDWAKDAIRSRMLSKEFPKILDNFAKFIENDRLQKLVNPASAALKDANGVDPSKPQSDSASFYEQKKKERLGIKD